MSPAILTEYGLHTDLAVRPFIDAGFTVTGCTFERIPEMLATGRFTVLLVGKCELPRKTKQEEQAVMQRVAEAMQRFVQAGGGILFFLPVVDVIPIEDLLSPFGIDFLKLYIDQPEATHNEGTRQFAYTEHISGPVAAGVRGVWFPNNMEPAVATRPIRATEGWQVVVRGHDGSHTRRPITEGYGLADDRVDANAYPDRVPIMALRDGLPGRLAVCGIPGSYHLFSPHNYPTAQRLLEEGFAGKPSDLRQLVINTLRWLAAPALRAGRPGGAGTDPDMLIPQVPRFPDDPPVRWAAREFPPDSRLQQGLIGARTAYSTGRGSVAEYVAKARATGHDFIVFLEDFAALTEEKFRALAADCRAHSTDDFFAIPGYTIRDCVGSSFFIYGWEAALPRADLLSDDGTMLATRAQDIDRPVHRVEYLHMHLIFGELKMRCRKGAYLHHTSQKGVLQNRFNDSFAVLTWEDGRVIDDAREHFHMLNDKGLRLNPTVLTLMHGPEDFERAVASGWRNTIIEPYETMQEAVLRKHMAPELEWWGTMDEEVTRSPRYRFDSWQYGNPFQVVTSGPEIRAWAVSASGRDPSWRGTDAEIPPTADWFRADVAQFRLRLKATSAAGLAEVLLFDGDRPVRRWQCGGAASFERELDLVHHQQMHLMLEARDVRGGAAYTSDFLTLRLDWCEFYCADRNNPLCIGYEKDERGLAYGWSGTTYLTYNNYTWGGNSPWIGRWWVYGDPIHPAPQDPVRDVIAPTDGGVGFGAAGLHLQISMPALDPPELGLMVNPIQEMISTDAAICGFIVDEGYDLHDAYFHGNPATGFGLFAAYPTRYVSLCRRAIAFRPKPQALTAMIYQHDLRWKRNPHLAAPLQAGWLDTGSRHELQRTDGTRLDLSAGDAETYRWRRNDAVVCWTDGARPAIFINDGADLLLAPHKPGRMTVLLPIDALPTAEAAATIRILAAGGTHAYTDPAVVDKLRAAMGLSDGPAYAVNLEQGECLSTRLVLSLDGRGAGAAFTLPRVELPMALPITVSNLNPNWPVFLVDRSARRWRPLGALDGTAYATLDTARQDWCVFLGHPVVASHPHLVISLAQISEEEWALEVHNPTGTSLEAEVTPSPYFDLPAWDGAWLALPPGTSQVLALKTRSVLPV